MFTCRRLKLNPICHLAQKLRPKLIKDLNEKHETVKLLKKT